MGFLSPILLLGVLAAAIPILLHLHFRQRGQRVEFSAMALLARSLKREERGIRLKQLLLLALRVSLLLLLPLAMAQPFSRCGANDELFSSEDRLPASVVFVVEDSYLLSSTQASEASWAAASAAVEERLRQLRAWDRAGVLVAAAAPVLISPAVGDRAAISTAWADYEPRYSNFDLAAALSEARAVHAEADQPARRTVIIGSGSAEAWADLVTRDASRWQGLGQIEFVDLPQPERHVGINALTINDDSAAGVTISATLEGSGTSPGDRVRAELRVAGEEVDVRDVELDGDGRGSVTFSYTPTADGPQPLSVWLVDAPGWGAAQRRFAVLDSGGGARVLLVNGDPRSSRFNDELYFLEQAISALVSGGVSVRPSTVNAEALNAGHLQDADAVFLVNVASLPNDMVELLRERVQGGMGLFISAGDNLNPDTPEQRLAPLLPRPMRSRRRLAEPNDPDAAVRAVRFANVDRQHPVFRVFATHGGESLQSVQVYQYILLEPQGEGEVRTIATFSDGAPALVERRLGNGRLLMWTSTLDMDWTDLPLRGAYVPMIHRILEYVGRGGGSMSSNLSPGGRLELDLSSLGVEAVDSLNLLTAERRRLESDADNQAIFLAERPGVWRLSGSVDGESTDLPESMVVVEPIHTSWPVELVDEDARREWAEGAGEGIWGEGSAVVRRNLWPWLLFIALVIFYSETLVAMRRRAWQRIGGVFGRKAELELR